ncbi:MAG: DUF6340 family protein [Candidatus Cryptobacteroides sp.]
MKYLSHLLKASLPLLAVMCSCAPQALVVSPEMRGPSKSGMNLFGKSIAIVYQVGDSENSNNFSAGLADGFASRLEEDYFNGEPAVEAFTVKAVAGVDYSCRDSLRSLVMQTGKDVVFLVGNPSLGEPSAGEPSKVVGGKRPADSSYVSIVKMPFSVSFHVYDSMGYDEVKGFEASKEMKPQVFCPAGASSSRIISNFWKGISEPSYLAGYQAAGSFVSTWKTEHFCLVYYDTMSSSWDRPTSDALSFNWKDAIEGWISLLDTSDPEKKACACYNIALGCFMMGQPALALEWLDRSDAERPISLSTELRSKIKEYTGK